MRYFKPGQNEKESLFTPLPLDYIAGRLEEEQKGFDTAMTGLAGL